MAVSSVANALRILLLLNSNGPLGVVELSSRLGIGRSTAHRLLSTLRSFHFVEQEAGKKYRIGAEFSEIAVAHSPQTRLVAAARRELEMLADLTGETANLVIIRGPDAVFIDGVEGTRALRIATRTGDRVPAYSSAGGKLLLAELSPQEIYQLYPGSLDSLASLTVPGPHKLVDRLGAIRRQGYATSYNECVDGVAAVAVGITDSPRQTVAAVTVSVPSSRFSDERAEELVRVLDSAARTITSNLAGTAGAIVDTADRSD